MIEVHKVSQPLLRVVNGGVIGEALVLDLGYRGLVFILLVGGWDTGGVDQDRAQNVPMDAFLRTGQIKRTSNGEDSFDQIVHLKAKADLIPSEMPMMVRFRNIHDPTTVERVDPTDMAKTLGSGVSLKRMTVEMTDEPVTVADIRKAIPAFHGVSGYFSGQRTLDRLHAERNITFGAFTEGIRP